MSAAKFTPGPWSVRPYVLFSGESTVGNVIDRDGNTVRVTGMALSGGPECEANAYLIAAAPELLAALVALRRAELEDMDSDDNIIELRKQADAAIRKATGAAS